MINKYAHNNIILTQSVGIQNTEVQRSTKTQNQRLCICKQIYTSIQRERERGVQLIPRSLYSFFPSSCDLQLQLAHHIRAFQSPIQPPTAFINEHIVRVNFCFYILKHVGSISSMYRQIQQQYNKYNKQNTKNANFFIQSYII